MSGKNTVLMGSEKNMQVRMSDVSSFREECKAFKCVIMLGVKGLANYFTYKNILNWYMKTKS